MNCGELWILELPFIEGREQRGIRPVLIVKDTKTGMILVIPLTSNPQALRFPYTLEIKKSINNGLEKDSIALVFQIQSLDKRRFVKKIGNLEHEYIERIGEILKEMIEF